MIGEKALDTVSEYIKENISLTLVESDIFTHQFLNKGTPIYNLGFRSVLTGDIDLELLVKTYINTVRSYKTLYFGFNVDDSHPYKNRVELLQPIFDIRPSWPEKDEWIEWLRKPFDLTTPPLLRCIFSPVNDSEWALLTKSEQGKPFPNGLFRLVHLLPDRHSKRRHFVHRLHPCQRFTNLRIVIPQAQLRADELFETIHRCLGF